MPTPELTDPVSAGPVAAVRAVLDALAVPAARQALLLEQALTAQMAVFTGAPAAAAFDPLARSAVSAAPRAARPQPGEVRRKSAPAKAGEPASGPGLGAVGAAAVAALQAAQSPPPPAAQSILTGIAAAVAALTARDAASPRRPSPPPPERVVRGATLGVLGTVAQTTHAAAKALDAIPGAGVTAPVLERIAEIGGALWLQMALSPPGKASSSNASADNGSSARDVRPASRVAARAASGGASSPVRPAAAAGAASREATSPVETVTDALAGIGRLTVELFGAAARAGTPDLLGTAARPAPRAPNLLTPQRAPESTSRPASGSPATTTRGVAIDIDSDALARALRAEADLRGVVL